MHDSFEKEVQQKMDALQLQPSAPVWEKIELQIRPEKKRRRGLIWFLLAGLLLAGGGTWWLTSGSDNNALRAEAKPHKTTGKLEKETLSQTTEPVHERSTPPQEKTPVAIQPSFFDKPKSPIAGIAIAQKKTNPVAESNTIFPSSRQKANAQNRSTKDWSVASTPAEENPSSSANPVAKSQTVPEEIKSTTDSSAFAKPDSMAVKPDAAKPAAVATDSTQKKKIAGAARWRKQILLRAGWSSYAEAGSSAKAYANNFFSSPQTIGNPGGATSPSSTKAGPGFSAGFALAKKIGDQWELSFGLTYSFLTTKTAVGTRNTADTLLQYNNNSVRADAYYANAGSGQYSNRFHLAELPVSLSFKPATKVPLSFSATLAYGRLLHTNALTYNASANLYYRNPQNDQRHSLPLAASVQVELFGKTKTPLRIGPFVQYNLLRLQKENSDAKPHLVFAGLRTSVLF